MPFQPGVNQPIEIAGVTYRVAEHPAAPGLPYGQEGRAATVYQLVAGGEQRALKVFKPRFQIPALVALADRLASYADLPGLTVCRRTVLTARRHADLLEDHPDLTYSVLMPWIAGPTWMEVLVSAQVLAPEQSLALARALADVLAGMEEQGLAHGDLSAPNLLLPSLANFALPILLSPVELVDVEQMYAPDLRRPDPLQAGSPGYAHPEVRAGCWNANMDRFAGAVLLAEMLGWCDARVRAAAWGESYFNPAEIQQPAPRAGLLVSVLEELWGVRVADHFKRAWESNNLVDCPTFGAWLAGLPRTVPAPPPQPPAVRATPQPAPSLSDDPATSPSLLDSSRGSQTDINSLFLDGLTAYQAGHWNRAQELLGAVVRQQPDYERGGDRAAALLREAERCLAPPVLRPPHLGWIIGSVGLVLAVLVTGALMLGQMQAAGRIQAQAAETAEAVYGLATAQSQGTATALAEQVALAATRTQAAAAGQATGTAGAATTAASQQTAIAAATATGHAQAAAAGTAAAQGTAAVLAQSAATQTQSARAAGMAAAQTSTATNQAVEAIHAVTGTAQAQATDTAKALARHAAQAQSTSLAQTQTAAQVAKAATQKAGQQAARTRTAQAALAASKPTKAPPSPPVSFVVPVPVQLSPSAGITISLAQFQVLDFSFSCVENPSLGGTPDIHDKVQYEVDFQREGQFMFGGGTECVNEIGRLRPWEGPPAGVRSQVWLPGHYQWYVSVYVVDGSSVILLDESRSSWRSFTLVP